MFTLLGKLCLQKNRLFLFLLVGALPLFFSLFLIFPSFSEIGRLREEIYSTYLKAAKTYPARLAKKEFFDSFSKKDPSFLSLEIEKPLLLEKEQKLLSAVSEYPLFAHDPAISHRLAFLRNNHLSFTEKAVRTKGSIKETEFEANGVEVDPSDVNRLLSLIEKVDLPPFSAKKESPQLIITDFHLDKRDHLLLTLHLLQREFQ